MTTLASAVGEELPEGRSGLFILDQTGDTRIIWDPDNPDEVEIARQTFASAQAKGLVAYRVNRKGEKTSDVVREFDPRAEKLIMAPPLRGG